MKIKNKKNLISFFKEPKNMILTVILISMVIVGVFIYRSLPDDVDKLTMAYSEILDADVLKQNVKTSFKQTYELKDYTVYGENLMLYDSMYSADSVDGLLGKNVVLRNIETDNELIFTFSGGVDSGINLAQLDEGMYEIYVYDHYKKKRVFFSDEFNSEKFTTMRRNDTVKFVTLNTTKDYLEELDMVFDENYAFLTVIDNTPVAGFYDVMIDPSALVVDISSNEVDYGYTSDEFNEASESYSLALLIKDDLEKHGLRVKLTRDENEELSYYGKLGRAGKGYESQAKVFLGLSATMDEDVTYPYLMSSPYTSALMANEVAYYVKQNGIKLTPVSLEDRFQEGVLLDYYVQEYDEDLGYYVNTKYELYPQLRETGGKSTFAGEMEGTSENQMYQTSYGMYSMMLFYTNVNESDSVQYYQQNKVKLAKTIADGICNYFKID